MKTAQDLQEQLEPFIKRRRPRIMSEIEDLLEDIYWYLTAEVAKYENPREDPTTKSQMNLDLTPPSEWQPLSCGLIEKNIKTGAIRKNPNYSLK